jgi:hypothetical protein
MPIFTLFIGDPSLNPIISAALGSLNVCNEGIPLTFTGILVADALPNAQKTNQNDLPIFRLVESFTVAETLSACP